ncbi:hypothetical protein ACU4GD_08425 [Cupriavidus basilensis]
MPSDFDTGLGKNPANHVPLTPVDYLVRAAEVYGDRLAIVHGPVRQNWRETYARARRLGQRAGESGRGQVAIPLPPCCPTRPPWWRRISACRWPGRCSMR